jgi:sec-independent protein translocase protein TatB
MNFFGIGFTELILVLVIALLVLGPNKMLEVARTMGKYARDLQRATSELPRLLSLDEDSKRPTPDRRQVPAPTPNDPVEPSGPEESTPRE